MTSSIRKPSKRRWAWIKAAAGCGNLLRIRRLCRSHKTCKRERAILRETKQSVGKRPDSGEDDQVIAEAYRAARAAGRFGSDEDLLEHLQRAVCENPPSSLAVGHDSSERAPHHPAGEHRQAIVTEFELASSVSASSLPGWAVAARTEGSGGEDNPFANAKAGKATFKKVA